MIKIKSYLVPVFLFFLFILFCSFMQVDPEPARLPLKLIVAIILGAYELIVRLIPTVNDYSWLSWLIRLIAFLNDFLNRKKK